MLKQRWKFAILVLVLLASLSAANLPVDAGPSKLGVGLRFSSWLDLRSLEAFASLRIRDNFFVDVGTWVLPIPPALSLLIVDAKVYARSLDLGIIELKPFLGGGGIVANIPCAINLINLRAFGGADFAMTNLSLFAEGGLGYLPIPSPRGLPSPFFTLGMRFDL